jgi:hypothetical protein
MPHRVSPADEMKQGEIKHNVSARTYYPVISLVLSTGSRLQLLPTQEEFSHLTDVQLCNIA